MSPLPNPLGGERLSTSWRGHQLAYVQRGVGPPMVFVHSVHACAWSMEWRTVVPTLSAHFTTYSLDLLGFGASDHPPLEFTGALYVELISDFLVEVVRAPCVAVGSSLGATYLIAAAARHPERVRAVCAIGPAGVTRLDSPGGAVSGLVQRFVRSERVGAAFFGALTSKRSIRMFLKDIYADPKVMTDEVVDLYWQSAKQPNARFGPAAFVGFRLSYNLRAELAAMTQPLMLAWGTAARQTPLKEAAAYQRVQPRAELVTLPGGDLPHEEHPEAFCAALLSFLSRH
jgi:pimeloyl-ACP methyl ester carboxylesterase